MITLSEYLKAPKSLLSCLPEALLRLEGETGQKAVQLASDLASADDRRIFFKKRQAKKLLSLLFGKGRIKFSVVKKLSVAAYMDDRGSLTMSLGCFFKLSSAGFLIVLFHELAHLLMSECSEYSHLKQLDREFLCKFSSFENAKQLSPVEMAADMIALGFINGMISEKVRTEKKRQQLRGKLCEKNEKHKALLSEIMRLSV